MYWTYNGINMAEYLRIIDIRGREVSPYELQTLSPIGSESDFVTYRSTPRRTIEIDFEIRGTSRENLRQKIDEISSILVTGEKVPVTFSDEPNITYLCEYAGATQSYENPHIFKHRGTITLLRDRFKYGTEQYVEFEDSIAIENNGTVEAKPVIELIAKEKVTFAMISDGTNYNMVGRPASVNEQVIDTKTALINENGETINTWTTAPSEWEGGSQGTIGYDGAGITAPSYGTGTSYHGPSVIKEITPTQDFEIELRGQLLTDNPNQTGRFGFFLFDENMNEIAFMTACDNTANVNQKLAEARLGEFISVGKNYLISSNNYLKKWDNFPALLKLTRIGKSFTFYVARIQGDGSHMEPLTVRWNDTSSQYNGKLKYVGIFIDKYGTTASPHTNRIDYIKAWGLTKETTDQTPYIAQPGDVFLFDHVNNQILLNGESIKSLKDFGGTYFTIPSGQSALTILPENAFDAKVKFSPRYR